LWDNILATCRYWQQLARTFMTDKETRRLRTPEAANYLGLSASTLEKLRLWGTGPTYYKAGAKIVVYEQADLDAWLHARRQTSTSENRERTTA
jgi:predicted DNA-binding transcriptional regulator AlpA